MSFSSTSHPGVQGGRQRFTFTRNRHGSNRMGPLPASSSGMHALLAWPNLNTAQQTRHGTAAPIGNSTRAPPSLAEPPTPTRVDRMLVHPTAPPLPYSHSPAQVHPRSGRNLAFPAPTLRQRVTSRFWTDPTHASLDTPGQTSSSTRQPPPLSAGESPFVTGAPTTSFAVIPCASPSRHLQTESGLGVALPTPSQTPHTPAIGIVPVNDHHPFVPRAPALLPSVPTAPYSSTPFPSGHSSSGQQSFFVHGQPSSPPAYEPITHLTTHQDHVLAEHNGYHDVPHTNDRSQLSSASKPDLIADFRARLSHPSSALSQRLSRPSGFAWDCSHERLNVHSNPSDHCGHEPYQELCDEKDVQSHDQLAFATLRQTAVSPLHSHAPFPPTVDIAGPPRLPQRSHGGTMPLTAEMVPAPQLAMRHGGQLPVKPVSDLPPRFRGIFPFPCFNYIQTQCFDHLIHSDTNLVTSAPTGSGKTALLDLALIRLWITHPSSRAVYLAPTKALCAERATDWTRRLQPLGITVAELTGDTSMFDARDAHRAQLLVITSEKYDAVTRRWRESSRTRQFVAQVGLVLIDEVHLLASSRGATLEALVARMKVVAAELKTDIRYVALSATFPNIQDVGTWLGGEAKVLTFGEEYRPVRLERRVLGFSNTHRTPWQFDKLLDTALPDVLREHAAGKPALVFCATRKATEGTAKLLATGGNGPPPGTMGHAFVRTSQHARTLVEAAQRVRNHVARDVLVHGVAFHHAGVEMADRQLIEQLFLTGQLLVLCTTSTLAVGVNLPAYLVVLKGTQTWAGGEMKEYPPMDVMQMLGRAGRPQFEASGKAIIMTTANKVEEYESLVAGRTVVESSLHLHLVEHLNAEIAQGTVTNEQLAVQWLESTFLYVRLQVAPAHYANVVHGTDDLRKLVVSTLQVLTAAEMVREPTLPVQEAAAVGPRLECTEYGKLMSRYCLSLQTMQALMAGGPSIPQQLYSMALAGEFSGTYVKVGDKTMLAELNKLQGIKFRLPDKHKYKSAADKVYLVVQAVLGGVQLQGKDMDRLRVFVSCEQGNIWSALGRIAAAAVELHIARRDKVPHAADRIRYAILLLQSVRTKIWYDSTRVLRQLDKVGPVLTSTLANAGITTFDDLASAHAWRLEQLCRRNPPFGSGLVAAANQVPHFGVIGRLIQSTLLLSVTVANAATCKKAPHGGTSWVHVLVHDEVGTLLFHDRASLLNLSKSEFKASVHLSPSVHCVFASLLAEDYVGLDVHLQADPRTKQVSAMPRWLLPESAFAPPDSSADIASASSLPGPPPPPLGPPPLPPTPELGAQQQYGPRVAPPTPSGPHIHDSSASTSMIPYQPPAPPAPSLSDGSQAPCKHKCKDRFKCKHACCKRGLGDRPPSPMLPAVSKPRLTSQKKQLTLQQVIQALPQPVIVLSDSDSDDDMIIGQILDRMKAAPCRTQSTRQPTPKLTPPPVQDDVDDDWDDSLFTHAASMDVPQPPSEQAFVPSSRLWAHGQQQLTPPHTDTPGGDRVAVEPTPVPTSTLLSTSARGQGGLTDLNMQPYVSSVPVSLHNSGLTKPSFRFRADLLSQRAEGWSEASQAEGSGW